MMSTDPNFVKVYNITPPKMVKNEVFNHGKVRRMKMVDPTHVSSTAKKRKE
jgi:hypothetical protein